MTVRHDVATLRVHVSFVQSEIASDTGYGPTRWSATGVRPKPWFANQVTEMRRINTNRTRVRRHDHRFERALLNAVLDERCVFR